MDTHTARPTGRRQITPPQLRAEAPMAASFTPITPGRALAAFKRAGPALGVSRRVVDLVDCLMSYSPAQDWEGRPGLGPVVWPSDVELEDRLCIGPSQRKTLVRAAMDAGFMRLRRSPNGKRYGYRDRRGAIVNAYGFDLAPLAERMAEFERTAAEWQARRDEGRRLRREISSSRNQILSLVDLARMQSLEGKQWAAAAAQADALWHQRGSQRDPLPLLPIAARLRALCIHVQEQVTAALATVEDVSSDPMGPEYRPHQTTTTQVLTAKADTTNATAAGPNRPIAQKEESSRGQPGRCTVEGQPRVMPTRKGVAVGDKAVGTPLPQSDAAPPCPLRGFMVTPAFILQVAPIFRDWTSSARPSWQELARVAYDIRGAIGISPHAWGQAWIMLGSEGAIAALAAICARHAAGQVKSPGGLLRKMVELHQKGTLRLDATLFGLADKLKKAQP